MAYKQEYMELAIELAKKGTGAVNPNPLVGAVIVKDDRIIGQGYHARYGDLHAERAAFASLTEDATRRGNVCNAGAMLSLWQTAPMYACHRGTRHKKSLCWK